MFSSSAATYGTPLFLYDSGVLVGQYQRLRRALPPAIDIYYSVKANPHPRVIGIFVGQGAGCEIASGGEYALARRGGVLPRGRRRVNRHKLPQTENFRRDRGLQCPLPIRREKWRMKGGKGFT